MVLLSFAGGFAQVVEGHWMCEGQQAVFSRQQKPLESVQSSGTCFFDARGGAHTFSAAAAAEVVAV